MEAAEGRDAERPPKLSVVVVAYDFDVQIERTVRSLSPAMQRDIDGADYEIIVVDNGSPQPIDPAPSRRWGAQLTWRRIDDASPSPAAAVNLGLREARGEVVGVMVDGARLASPGLLAGALAGASRDSRAVVASHGFHLGSKLQQLAAADGYDEAAEAELLAGSGWEEDGYRLFGISVFGASSRNGWRQMPFETNALFMGRELWREIGGFDEAFASPGGGLVNLDILVRALELPGAKPVLLLGEATFHQVHGGASTGGRGATWDEMHAEYISIRGRPFALPDCTPELLGAEPSADRR